jgi:hypothetical protein
MKKQERKIIKLKNIWRVNSTMFDKPTLNIQAKTSIEAARKYADFIGVVLSTKKCDQYHNGIYNFVIKSCNKHELPHVILVGFLDLEVLT